MKTPPKRRRAPGGGRKLLPVDQVRRRFFLFANYQEALDLLQGHLTDTHRKRVSNLINRIEAEMENNR